MKSFHLALLAAAALVYASPTAAQTASPVVKIDTGELRGASENGVASWKGVPFAAAPVGALRWRAPQPTAKWSGVREATAYSSDCMQKPFGGDAAPLGTTPAEDCLYANVWKPTAAKSALPVVVWIYGGGFVNGGASPPTYSGANLAKQGVMFVSFNYRVGRFGTFALPQLTKQDPDHGLLGNYGILDQIAALKWVQRNIAAFGGDPSNVTIIGESAGGLSVHTLVTTPLARGLFQKAMVLSGGNAETKDNPSLTQVEQIYSNFAKANGVSPDDPKAMDKLRALSAEQVTDDLSMIQLFQPKPGPKTFSGPFRDGRIVVDQGQAYASGKFTHVPMIIGATSADMGGKSGYMIAGARSAAARIAKQGVPVWHYRFSYVADSVGQPGAQHATEVPFFFDNAAIKYGAQTTPKDIAVGKTVSAYVVNFAKAGDPNGAGLPAWPKYDPATDPLMDFSAGGAATPQKDPWGEEIDKGAARLAAAQASGHYNSLTTELGTLLDDPAARAVLERHMAEVVRSPQINMARGLTLTALQSYLPQPLTDATLQQIDTELAALPKAK
jgi:para-nitrobenzyl esterase